jgi:hypothetical protein
MGEERKKAGFWPWVVALLIGLPLLYVASFGPACWIAQRTQNQYVIQAKDTVYLPLLLVMLIEDDRGPIRQFLHWYMQVGYPDAPKK